MEDQTPETNEEEVLEEPNESNDADEQETEDAAEADEEQEDTDDDAGLLKERLRIAEEKALRYKAERDRLKEKGVKPKTDEPAPSADTDIIRLEARGFLDEDEQQAIIKASKTLGISVVEAAKDDLILERIERMRRAKKAALASDRPSNGSGAVKKDADYYIRTGKIPTDPDMIEAYQNELIRRARKGR